MTCYFEDLSVGQVIDYGSHTTDREDMIAFAGKWDPRPFHVDDDFAKTTMYGGLTASGIHTMAIFTELCNRGTSDWAVRGAFGYEKVRFPTPVRPGDTLTGRSLIVATRLSKSRPGFGIITSDETLTNQNGEPALELTVSFLIEVRPT